MSSFPCLVRFVSGSGQVRYRFGVGRIDSARLAAIMLLIHGWRRGPERVSRCVHETMAARGNLAVANQAAGTRAGPFPLMPG
jgi:hypothetical protein